MDKPDLSTCNMLYLKSITFKLVNPADSRINQNVKSVAFRMSLS